MLGKLLSLVAQAKGAAIASVVVVGAATTTVAVTTPEVQDAVQQFTTSLGMSGRDCLEHGQPVVVAQRNAADKLLRDAYQRDHKALSDLRGGGKDVDAKAVGDIVRNYDDQLRDTLNKALNDVAALTLGREGQLKASASPSGSPAPTPTATATATATSSATGTAKPSCTPAPSATGTPAATPSASPSASGSGKPETGRVAVANRTTLDAALQAIVEQAIKDMDDLVKKAIDEVSKVPPAEHGKPSGEPGNKPSEQPGGKPSTNPGNKPSNPPGRP